MADNKKYYYMRLKENFFESEEMILLESMPDGIIFSNILIKLYLKSLKNEGRLLFKDAIPYNSQMIATVTRHQVGTVEKALTIFKDLELIEVLDNGVIYMNDIELFIGKASTEAERKKKARMAIEEEKLTLIGQNADKCPEESGQMSDECPPEIRDKSLEIRDKSIKDTLSSKPDSAIPYQRIIEYLNQEAKTNYRHTTKKTKDLIKARFNEGFTAMDFKIVIDKKVATWLHDPNMNKYLRPETLFGPKFESYLNEKVGVNNRSYQQNHEQYSEPEPDNYSL